MHAPSEKERAKADDVLERVSLAVHALCVGKGDVRSRLYSALTDHLLPLRATDFPVALQGHFEAIMLSATRYDASDLDKSIPLPFGMSHNQLDGRIKSTMRRIRRTTGAIIAGEVWVLYRRLLEIALEPET